MEWDNLTEDGCWRKIEEGSYTDDELREKGKILGGSQKDGTITKS
ncbi:hypothetical protein [Paenibacillus sinensis]|nr:hypothetical protein [Paenibacillus sinensis]